MVDDGSNEENEYGNLYYESVNPSLVIRNSGNPNFADLNRWQPLEFLSFIFSVAPSGTMIVVVMELD